MRASKVMRAPTVLHESVVQGPLIAEAEQGTKVGAEGHSLTGPFVAMFWGPIQLFNWWSFLIGGGPAKATTPK
jgi:hypothetical protein